MNGTVAPIRWRTMLAGTVCPMLLAWQPATVNGCVPATRGAPSGNTKAGAEGVSAGYRPTAGGVELDCIVAIWRIELVTTAGTCHGHNGGAGGGQ